MRQTTPPSSEGSSTLLAALQTHADGDEIEPHVLAELVSEGLLTRASLADGFQLTSRGLTLVASTCPRHSSEDDAPGSAA